MHEFVCTTSENARKSTLCWCKLKSAIINVEKYVWWLKGWSYLYLLRVMEPIVTNILQCIWWVRDTSAMVSKSSRSNWPCVEHSRTRMQANFTCCSLLFASRIHQAPLARIYYLTNNLASDDKIHIILHMSSNNVSVLLSCQYADSFCSLVMNEWPQVTHGSHDAYTYVMSAT